MRSAVARSGNSRVRILITDKTVALVLAGIALGLGAVTLVVSARDYRELEREVRLQQLKLDEYRVALMNAGIDPNPHVEGESK